jgi:hypothetical protein
MTILLASVAGVVGGAALWGLARLIDDGTADNPRGPGYGDWTWRGATSTMVAYVGVWPLVLGLAGLPFGIVAVIVE